MTDKPIDKIMERMVNFICNSDRDVKYFYKSLSKDELNIMRDESIILKDSDTVKIIDDELKSRG
jgi:hypothetical protein